MAGIKDFFRNLLYETEEEEYDQPEETTVQPAQSAVLQQPARTVQPQQSTVPPQPPKAAVFGQLNADKLSAPDNEVQTTSRKRKTVKPVARKRVEAEEYQAVISPIFGNIEDDQKDLDLVHNAIDLPKPPENVEFVQVISPMYGSQPVHIEPKKMAAPAKENVTAPAPVQSDVPEQTEEPVQPVATMDLKTFLTKS